MEEMGLDVNLGAEEQEQGVDWETRCRDLEAENAELREDAAIDEALGRAGARNARCVRALLDREKLGEGLQGLEEQIQGIREQEAYLFYPVARKGCYGVGPEESVEGDGDAFLQGFGF